jgi:hypothetical protein
MVPGHLGVLSSRCRLGVLRKAQTPGTSRGCRCAARSHWYNEIDLRQMDTFVAEDATTRGYIDFIDGFATVLRPD